MIYRGPPKVFYSMSIKTNIPKEKELEMSANIICNVLEPQKVTLPLKNAMGQRIPAYSPGVYFNVDVAVDPGVIFDWRFLSQGEDPDFGIIITLLSPGRANVTLSASVKSPNIPNFNKVQDNAILNASGNPNFQQPQIKVTDSL